MKVLIIEDESPAAKILVNLLQELEENVVVLDILDSVKATLNWIEENIESIDVIFMDIELADGNSFEIFNHVELPAPVIFTTAYNKYAVDAFKVNALDYLLKPIELSDLRNAISRRQNENLDQRNLMQRQIEEMVSSFSTNKKNRCLVKKGSAYEFISVEDIALAYSEDSITFLLTFDGKRHTYSRTIEQLHSEINPSSFFQINRAQLINIDNVIQVHPYFGQRLKLKVRNSVGQNEVIVSRQRSTEFKKWLDS